MGTAGIADLSRGKPWRGGGPLMEERYVVKERRLLLWMKFEHH